MKFFLNNMSDGWQERLMEVLIRARPGDVIVVPNNDIAKDARIFAWAADVVGGIKVFTREEYDQHTKECAEHYTPDCKGGEYEQRNTFTAE